jgi:hypothetical protein
MDDQHEVKVFEGAAEDRVTVVVSKGGKSYVISFEAFPWEFADITAQVGAAANSVKQKINDDSGKSEQQLLEEEMQATRYRLFELEARYTRMQPPEWSEY